MGGRQRLNVRWIGSALPVGLEDFLRVGCGSDLRLCPSELSLRDPRLIGDVVECKTRERGEDDAQKIEDPDHVLAPMLLRHFGYARPRAAARTASADCGRIRSRPACADET